jgi:hypothetical protein
VVRAVEFDHPRTGNVVGEVSTRLHRHAGVVASMDEECRTVMVGRIGRTSI